MILNKELSVSRFGVGHESADAAPAVAACKALGNLVVLYEAEGRIGSGFYLYRLNFHGKPGSVIGTANASEEDAWLTAAVRLAYHKPGMLQMTSREFGRTYVSNAERRTRLEIRKIAGQFEVFHVECWYAEDKEPKDILQNPQDVVFATLAEAAGYVGQYIGDFEGAAIEDREAALEAHFERERESPSV